MRFNKLAPLALIALPLVMVAAACVPRAAPPTPAPVPAPAPAPTPTPTPLPAPTFSNWMDAPQTPGDWVYANGVATFGLPGQPRLEFRCTGGAVAIAYLGASAQLLTFRTETTQRSVPANGGTATLAARDPLLDAIAFSKGRFAVEAGNGALYPPAYSEISRVIEDCR